MAQSPVPRHPGVTSSAPSSAANRQPGSIDYTPAQAVGFELLPGAVVEALAEVFFGSPIAADADKPVAIRRSDGTYYQHATGWWAGTDRYIAIDARRLLAPVEGQERKLKPTTGWKIDGTISHFAPGTVPTNSQWRFDPVGGATSGKGPRPSADNPLDVLPAQLTAPVRGAHASAWQEYGPGWAEETIVAALAAHGRVRVLKVHRNGTSRRALQSTAWHAVTLDALIVIVQPFATDPDGRLRIEPEPDRPSVR